MGFARPGPGPGIVAGGDRAAGDRGLHPLAPWPPREVPGWALWSGAMHALTPLPLAFGLTLAGILIGVVSALPRSAGDRPPSWVVAAVLAAAVPLWAFAVRGVRRARRLLEGGMAGTARVTRIRVNWLATNQGRSRTTIEYEWSFGGVSGVSKQRGALGRRQRAPLAGSEITVLYDSSDPRDQLVPLFYGFRVEPA